MAKTESISDERLAEMLAGLEGLPPSPYWTGDNEAELIDGKGRWLNTSHGEPIWEHFARCDPDTIRSILTELATLRAANSDGGVEAEIVASALRLCAKTEAIYGFVDFRALDAEEARIAWDKFASEKAHLLKLCTETHPPAKALDGIAVTDAARQAVAVLTEFRSKGEIDMAKINRVCRELQAALK